MVKGKQLVKRICVIGAGISGLCSIKSCLEENFDVVCFEKEGDIGGIWNLNAKSHPTVPESRISNTCKEMFAFSDFPPPAEWPAWLNVRLVNEYLNMYAECFNLFKYIKFNITVEHVQQAEEYEQSGHWSVTTSDGKIEIFDGILICTGSMAHPFTPEVPGLADFKGRRIHSSSYKNFEEFEDKKVLIVGFGNSSVDIAAELSRHTQQVYLSTKRGGWVWGKMGVRGWPVDVRYVNRLVNGILSNAPKFLLNNHFEHMVNMNIDHVHYGLRPTHRFWSQEPLYADQLPVSLSNGSVILKECVQMLKEDSAVFDDGTEEAVDAVIFCTGYQTKFPFLSDKIVEIVNNRARLYKNVFPPQLRQPSLAIIGNARSMGGPGPLAEMQSRWAVRIFKKQILMPNREQMEIDIEHDEQRIEKNFYKSARHQNQVPYIEYMDALASQIGIKPNLAGIFLKDPKLFYHCFYGPCVGYQYRLTGPGCWSGAREAVMSTCDRIDQPLKTRRGMPAVWKPFDRTVMNMKHWFGMFMFLLCYITFGTDNVYVFYVGWTFLFSYLIFISFCGDLYCDFSTTF